MKRKDFQILAALRLKEAKTLLAARCWEGAYYLGGYAAECALKACIARKTERHEFPDKDKVNASYSHKLEVLLKLAGLDAVMKSAGLRIKEDWDIVRDWSEESRYRNPEQHEAEKLIEALDSKSGGFYRWVRKHW